MAIVDDFRNLLRQQLEYTLLLTPEQAEIVFALIDEQYESSWVDFCLDEGSSWLAPKWLLTIDIPQKVLAKAADQARLLAPEGANA